MKFIAYDFAFTVAVGSIISLTLTSYTTMVQNLIAFSNSTNEISVQVLNHLDNISLHFYNGLAIKSESTMAMVGGTQLRVCRTNNAEKSWELFYTAKEYQK